MSFIYICNMTGWVRFNLEEMGDFCPEAYSGSMKNDEASASEILEKIHSWSIGNPNNRIFVPLPVDQNLAWQSFCAVLKNLSRKNEEIFYFSSRGNDSLPPTPMRREIYVTGRGLSRYGRSGGFAEMPDWTEEVAGRIEDLGPLIIFYPSGSNGNRMIAAATKPIHKSRNAYMNAGLISLVSSLILFLFYYLNIGVEIELTSFSWILVFPIVSLILFISSVILLPLGARTSRKGVLKYAGCSAALFLLGMFGLTTIVIVLSSLVSGQIAYSLSQVLISRIFYTVPYALVFLSVFIYILPILRKDFHPGLYGFTATTISLYVIFDFLLPSNYIDIGAPPHYLIIGYYSPASQFTAPVSLVTLALIAITLALVLYTLIRLPALKITKSGLQNLSDNVAHD